MKAIVFIVLLTTSQFCTASQGGLTISERDCMVRNVYHEARGSKKDWIRVAKVLLARKEKYQSGVKFHSKSNNLCDLARSQEYSSKLSGKIKEIEVFKDIKRSLSTLSRGGKELFFTSHNGKMRYRER